MGSEQPISFTVNGAIQHVSADIASRTTLLSHLRELLHLTGAKVGCSPGDGDCGMCTVLVDGVPTKACLVPLADLSGQAVTTVEALAVNGTLDPVQEAFVRSGAIQCGFCTPAYVLATRALLAADPNPSVEAIKAGLDGILCRCTGYVKVIRAVQAAARFQQTGQWPADFATIGREPAADGGTPLGVPVVHKDAVGMVTGATRYADDLYPANALHCKLLFAACPSADILSIDTTEAEQTPGVALVLTHRSAPKNKVGPIFKDREVFASDRVRTMSDVLAAVYAESGDLAAEAARKIKVEYRETEGVFDEQRAMDPAAPKIHPNHPTGNTCVHPLIRRGDVEQAFAEAAIVVENEYSIPPIDHLFLEPEAAVAEIDEHGVLVVRVATQYPHTDWRALAAYLELPLDKVRLIMMPGGGGYGGKGNMTIHAYVALGALRTGRPVKLTATRAESFLIHHKKHPFKLRYKTAASRDGKLTALEATLIADGGAYAWQGPGVMQQATAFASGPYYIPNLKIDTYRLYSNNPSCGAFRGFGAGQAEFALESQMDILARALGLDPIEFRLQNALEVGLPLSTGQMLKASVGYKECLRQVQRALASYSPPPAAPGKKIGIGLAGGCKNCGIGQGRPDEAGAIVELTEDGHVRVLTGAADVGNGCTTVLAQIASHVLGIPYDAVEMITPDTHRTPDGGFTSAQRQTLFSGNAVMAAGTRFKEQLLGFVGDEYEINPEDVVWKEGEAFWSKDGKVIASNREVANRAAQRGVELRVEDQYVAPKTYGILGERPAVVPEDYRNYLTFSFTATAAVVEVDEQSGEARVLQIFSAADCGKVVNRHGLEGQIEGSLMMGLGYALSEEFRVERGRPTTLTLTSNGFPTIQQTPEMGVFAVEDPEPNGPFGAKGFAEAASLATPPAITNAIYDAVGVRIKDLPARPKKIRALMGQRQTAAQAG